MWTTLALIYFGVNIGCLLGFVALLRKDENVSPIVIITLLLGGSLIALISLFVDFFMDND